jgi:L-ascorbate metabolism protein UlaG (beta-lactamase superfamily)
MKLTYFVNTMMLLEGRNTRVLCDPWVTFDAESRSGLYNFPETDYTREEIAAIKPDFIYLTHTHADHFDPETLALFPKDTPFIVSWYKDNFTERAVRRLGFTDVRVCPLVDGLALKGDDHCWIEPSAVYSDVDSIALFRIDGVSVLNANDNPFHEEQCRHFVEKHGPPDAACVPYGFQGPYPMFYENLSVEEKQAESNKKKLRNYDIVADYVRTLKPKYLIPLAGGAIYGGKKALMMKYSGVGNAEEAVEHAKAQCQEDFEPIFLTSRNAFDFDAKRRDGAYQQHTHEGDWDYIERISQKPGPFDEGGLFWIDPAERIDLTPLLKPARVKQQTRQQHSGLDSDSVFFIDVGGPFLYRLCLADTDVSRVRETDITDDAYEIFRVPYSLMIGMLTRHYNYSNVKTQFIDFYRQPNIFNQDLHILMSHLHL